MTLLGKPRRKKPCKLHNDEQALELFAKAQKDYADDRNREAIDAFEHLLKCHSDIINDWNLKEFLGLCYYHTEDYDKTEQNLLAAWTLITGVQNKELNKLIICDYLGRTFYRKYDYPRGLEYFADAKTYFSHYKGRKWAIERYLFHLFKSRCHYEVKQYQEALEEFQKVQKEILAQKAYSDVSEDENMLALEMGRTQNRLGNLDEAKNLLESVDTSTIETYWQSTLKYELFMIYLEQRKYEAALKEFEALESLQMEGIDKARAYYILGILYFRQGDQKNARKNFDKSLSIPTPYDRTHKDCQAYLNDIDSLN
jgi:tetratricopeptide (TPR) repeat protein